MKKIVINNYRYWWNEDTNELFLDEEGKQKVELKWLSRQEKIQFDNETKYNQPMVSYY